MLFPVQTTSPVSPFPAHELTMFGVAMDEGVPIGSMGTTCKPVVPEDQLPLGTYPVTVFPLERMPSELLGEHEPGGGAVQFKIAGENTMLIVFPSSSFKIGRAHV